MIRPLTFAIKRGDRRPTLEYLCQLSDGRPVDLAGATVVFAMRRVGTTTTIGGAAAILDAPTGRVAYAWAAQDTATAGDYEGEFQITLSGQLPMTCPGAGYIAITITGDIAP